MRFYDYLWHKRRMDAGYRTMLGILLRAESSQDPHITRHGSLAEAVKYHTEDYMKAVAKLQEDLAR